MERVIKRCKKLSDTMKKSITMKMFMITTIVFIIFLTITFLSQRVLFEKIYNDKKESDIKNNVSKFIEVLNNSEDEAEVIESIKMYDSNYNASIAVFNTESNVFTTAKTDSMVIDKKNANIFDYVLKWIESDVNLVSKIINNEQITISFIDEGSNTKYLASAIMDNGNIIIGFTSLQYVKEAVGVIEIFYKYFYLVAIVFVAALSLLYSKLITTPIKAINKVATKMSNLDFSEKCHVISNDEIGNLGDTLNFLGENLDASLTSLQEANRKLQSDIDRERQIENMRKEFIADASHELKTPITLIKGYAEGIKDGIFLDGNIDFSLDVILQESDKMGKLVKDMLQISSLESGKIILRKELFYIDSLIEKMIKKLYHSTDNKNINFNMELKHIEVYGDVFKIEQVITNFLTNAIRHTNNDGSVFIYISEVDYGVRVSFENTGDFIKDDELDKIWDKFYKIDKSRNRKDGGTGLGLSIVKNIIDLHQGKCGVENTELGVKFYFTLPYSKSLL